MNPALGLSFSQLHPDLSSSPGSQIHCGQPFRINVKKIDILFFLAIFELWISLCRHLALYKNQKFPPPHLHHHSPRQQQYQDHPRDPLHLLPGIIGGWMKLHPDRMFPRRH
jgi:hypothetical protein